MGSLLFAIVVALVLTTNLACSSPDRAAATQDVSFQSFVYRGQGVAPIDDRHYVNPIQPGFYPDPSLCRVGDDYYLIHSTFAYFPGLPIFHSTDLVHWTQIGHVLDRPSQLKLDGANVSEGLFAPAISYHDGTFYVVCTNVSGGGNFVVTATDPAGPWSEPTYLPAINGIDPSLFFDDDGKAYLIHNGPPPENKSLYDGHRALWLFEFDPTTLSVNASSGTIVVNGGVDLSKKPVWIEGPHLIRKDGWYYIIAAEGGTGPQHSQVVLRSRSIRGPFEPWNGNPILTQRDLDPDRPNAITCVGHCDFVQTPAGDWWAVFLGCRPFDGDGTLTALGRETFLLPVDWSGDWPIITRPGQVVPTQVERPSLPASMAPSAGQTANFVWKDDFSASTLKPEWLFLRTPREQWYEIGGKPPALRMRPRPVELSSRQNPSFLARRQQHASFSAEVSVDLSTLNNSADAGLVAFQNGEHYLMVGVRAAPAGAHEVFIEILNQTDPKVAPTTQQTAPVSIPSGTRTIELQLSAGGRTYRGAYRLNGGDWIPVGDPIDGAFLTTARAGGFVGTVVGLYARQR